MNIKELVGKFIGCILLGISTFYIYINSINIINKNIMDTNSILNQTIKGGFNNSLNYGVFVLPLILSIIGLFLIVIKYDKK